MMENTGLLAVLSKKQHNGRQRSLQGKSSHWSKMRTFLTPGSRQVYGHSLSWDGLKRHGVIFLHLAAPNNLIYVDRRP